MFVLRSEEFSLGFLSQFAILMLVTNSDNCDGLQESGRMLVVPLSLKCGQQQSFSPTFCRRIKTGDSFASDESALSCPRQLKTSVVE